MALELEQFKENTMARTPKYWYDIMIAEKNTFATLNVYQPNIDSSQTLLDDLKTTSKVAVWRLLLWCVATAMYAFDVVLDLYKIYLESVAAKSRYGTLPWYASVAKDFQYGYSLSLIDLEYKYASIDESAKIIKLASAKDNETDGSVNVKIATYSGSIPVPIGSPQLAAFTTYINLIKPAGIRVSVINEASDELRLFISANYDPLVLSSNGSLISDPAVFPLENAVKSYLDSLDFDARFELMKCVDYLQLATGIGSVYITSASSRFGTNPFVVFDQHYYPRAGHMVIDPSTPLSSTITYTADV